MEIVSEGPTHKGGWVRASGLAQEKRCVKMIPIYSTFCSATTLRSKRLAQVNALRPPFWLYTPLIWLKKEAEIQDRKVKITKSVIHISLSLTIILKRANISALNNHQLTVFSWQQLLVENHFQNESRCLGHNHAFCLISSPVHLCWTFKHWKVCV